MRIRICLKKCSIRLIFHKFWLVVCKLMLIRFRIQLITLMRIQILIFIWCGSGSVYLFDVDPGYQNDADPDPQHWFWEHNVYFSCVQIHIRLWKGAEGERSPGQIYAGRHGSQSASSGPRGGFHSSVSPHCSKHVLLLIRIRLLYGPQLWTFKKSKKSLLRLTNVFESCPS